MPRLEVITLQLHGTFEEVSGFLQRRFRAPEQHNWDPFHHQRGLKSRALVHIRSSVWRVARQRNCTSSAASEYLIFSVGTQCLAASGHYQRAEHCLSSRQQSVRISVRATGFARKNATVRTYVSERLEAIQRACQSIKGPAVYIRSSEVSCSHKRQDTFSASSGHLSSGVRTTSQQHSFACTAATYSQHINSADTSGHQNRSATLAQQCQGKCGTTSDLVSSTDRTFTLKHRVTYSSASVISRSR
jgi:hypothetical protein